MKIKEVGQWLLHCHVNDHMLAGMETTYTVTESRSKYIYIKLPYERVVRSVHFLQSYRIPKKVEKRRNRRRKKVIMARCTHIWAGLQHHFATSPENIMVRPMRSTWHERSVN